MDSVLCALPYTEAYDDQIYGELTYDATQISAEDSFHVHNIYPHFAASRRLLVNHG